MSVSRSGDVLPPRPKPKPVICSMCGAPVRGELVRVALDGELVCAGCDPSVPNE